jgi:hypothetical protein
MLIIGRVVALLFTWSIWMSDEEEREVGRKVKFI